MKKKIAFLFTVLMLCSFTAFANGTTLEFSIAAGENSTDAYLLGIKKHYSPWIQRGNFSVVPALGVTGFVWDPKHGDAVGGVSFLGALTLNFDKSGKAPYLAFSFGPTLISAKHVGNRDMGGQFHFASTASLGFRFGSKMRHALEGFYTHYSHGGLGGSQNPGLNIYGVTYKYSF